MEKRRTPVRMFTTIALSLVGAYVVWAFTLFLLQDHLVFPRWAMGGSVLPGPPEGFEEWAIETDEGRVHAWFLPGVGANATSPRGVVVMLHGNGMLIDRWIGEASYLAGMGWNVLLPEFRGYGRAEGRPSEEHLRTDVLAFIDLLEERPEVDTGRLVYFGRSIGGALATQVALERTPAGMILQTPPASVAGLAWRYGVPPFLVRSPFDTIGALRGLEPVPILLIQHDEDEVIPASHLDDIMEVVPDARHVVLQGGHNGLDTPADEQRFIDEMTAFLGEVAPAGR